LRNASDQFFEWIPTDENAAPVVPLSDNASSAKIEELKVGSTKPCVKRRPKFLIEAVSLMTSDTSEGKVSLGALGQYLKRTDPGFSPTTYGHSGLLDMVKTYDLLKLKQEEGGHWTVGLVPKIEVAEGHD
jgi:hypothetical protein